MFGLALSVQPVQVLPVPSRRSGLSAAAACCSHSSPSGSQWPCRGPFSSSLDGRSVSLPSESCTQRCLCQLHSRGRGRGQTAHQNAFQPTNAKKKKKKKRYISLYSHYCSIIYIFTSFSPFHTVQECCGNHSSVCHRAGIRPASETADFNLYLNPLGPRVQTQTKLLGLCRERVRLKSLFSYSAPCGDVIYEEKEFLKEGDVKVQRFTLLEVDLC